MGLTFNPFTGSFDFSGGTGDTSGPGSSTDSAIVLFNGTTGKSLKDSTVSVTGAAGILTFNDATESTSASTGSVILAGGLGVAKRLNVTGLIASTGITGSRAVISNSLNQLVASSVTSSEIGFLSGVTSGIQSQFSAKEPTLPITTIGDILFRNNSNVTSRLPIGSSGQVLTVTAGAPAWGTPASYTSPLTTVGDIFIRDGGNQDARLPIGSNGKILTVTGGLPSWEPAPSTTLPLTTIGDVLIRNLSNVDARLAIGSTGQVLTVGSSGIPEWAAGGGGGGGGYDVVTISTSTNAVSGKTYLIDTTTNNVTLTLPTPALNAFVRFKDKSGNASVKNITLARNASEKIEGVSASRVFVADWGTWTAVSDGTDWFLVY